MSKGRARPRQKDDATRAANEGEVFGYIFFLFWGPNNIPSAEETHGRGGRFDMATLCLWVSGVVICAWPWPSIDSRRWWRGGSLRPLNLVRYHMVYDYISRKGPSTGPWSFCRPVQ